MKTLISTLIFFITSVYFAQTIPLQDIVNYSDRQGKYFKDPSGPFGILDAYTGVWRWTEGNRELTFYLYKQEAATLRSLSGLYQSDVIVGYYIYKENGEELINTKQDLIDKYDLYDGKMYLDRGGVGMAPRTSGYDANTAPPFYFSDHSVLVCSNDNYVPMQGTPGSWRFINPTTAKVGLPRKPGGYTCGPEVVVHPNFPTDSGLTIHKIANEAPLLD